MNLVWMAFFLSIEQGIEVDVKEDESSVACQSRSSHVANLLTMSNSITYYREKIMD